MNQIETVAFAPFLISVIALIGGCASIDKCESSRCGGDAKITADVQARLDRMADFGPPGSIHVQTVNGVAYLNGQVTGGLAKRLADSVATSTPGVHRVVDSIDAEHE